MTGRWEVLNRDWQCMGTHGIIWGYRHAKSLFSPVISHYIQSNFFLCVSCWGWVSGWGKHTTIKTTCAVIQLALFVVSIFCPWHWQSKFHVQLKMNFTFKTLHNFLSCISISLLSCHTQPNILLIFALIPMFSPLSLMIPFPPSHVTFQLTTFSQCRDFQKPLQFQDILADPRIKNAHTEVNSYWNVYTEVKDWKESIAGWALPACCCLWSLLGDDGKASPHSNSTEKGLARWPESCLSGWRHSRFSHWCHLVSCQNRIMWTTQGLELADIFNAGQLHT